MERTVRSGVCDPSARVNRTTYLVATAARSGFATAAGSGFAASRLAAASGAAGLNAIAQRRLAALRGFAARRSFATTARGSFATAGRSGRSFAASRSGFAARRSAALRLAAEQAVELAVQLREQVRTAAAMTRRSAAGGFARRGFATTTSIRVRQTSDQHQTERQHGKNTARHGIIS